MSYRVHRLVSAAFLGSRPKGYDIHHLNNNKVDNRLENIEYKSKLEHVGGENNASAKLTKAKVLQILDLLEQGHMTKTAIGERFNVARTTVYQIKKKMIWKHITREQGSIPTATLTA